MRGYNALRLQSLLGMLRGRTSRLPDFGGGTDLKLVNASDFEPLLWAFEEHGLGGFCLVL